MLCAEQRLYSFSWKLLISQFAPESETVKDKQVHTACGVAEFYPAGKTVRAKSGFHPEKLSDPNGRYGMCETCGALKPDTTPVKPAADGGKPERVECPVCHQQTLLMVDARAPWFFHDTGAPGLRWVIRIHPASHPTAVEFRSIPSIRTEDDVSWKRSAQLPGGSGFHQRPWGRRWI